MKEILCLHCTIVNGPLLPSELWEVVAELILRNMEPPKPSSFLTSEEYSKFILVHPTSHLAATGQAEPDLEDDLKLCNEISML